MKRLSSFLAGAGLTLLLAGAARADSLFTYNSTVTSPLGGTFSSGDSSVQFTGQNPILANAGGIGTDVVLANVAITSEPASPATFDTFNDPYSILLSVTHNGDTQNLTYTGTLGGNVGNRQSNLTNAIDQHRQVVLVGGVDFVFDYKSFTEPSPAGGSRGAISAHVTAVPEPGTMPLVATGLLPMAGLLRRRKK